MKTYKICQMDVAICIQQHVVRLHVTVDDALRVDIAQSASQLRDPEPHSLFCKCLSRDVEPQVAAGHQVDNEVHILDVLKTVSQIANKRMIHVFEHATFANDVANAFGSDN